MPSRAPPRDSRRVKQPLQSLNSDNECHHHLTKVSSFAHATLCDPVVSDYRGKLPILRSQYVAPHVQVLYGSRWRLNRFQTCTIILHTGTKKPLLAVSTASSNLPLLHSVQPETTYGLTLDTTCHVRDSHYSQSTDLELLKTSASAFRLRIRFTTATDASIWCTIVRNTIAHAKWIQETRPVPQDDERARGSSVRLVQHVPTLQRFVFKVLAVSDERDDCHELQILQRLYKCQQELVRGYKVVETRRQVLLIMPQLPGLTLLQFLRQRRQWHVRECNEDQAWRLGAQLATLLQQLHRAGIVHCDLNLENVLIAHDLSRVWLIDFGGACHVLDNSNSYIQNEWMIGTPGYVAPERVQYPLLVPTQKTDVFSFGILLFQVLTGQHPYLDATRENRPLQLQDSLQLDWSQAKALLTARAVSDNLCNLIKRMLLADPQARISMDQVRECANANCRIQHKANGSRHLL